jgi:ABC-type transport system involved in cytochrome bd biosynthesis fused ATPase/permease subunit
VAVSNADIAAKGYEAEGALAGSKEGKLFAAAGESMWLAQHGKTLSGGQQHQLAAAEKLLEQHAISGESTVQLLASLHNKQDRLNKKIAELAAKVQQSHIR